MNKPIILQSIYQTRVWGGRNLETVFGRKLPGGESVIIGESWDVVDRAEEQSVVIGGYYADQTLGDLWREKREDIFGHDAPVGKRFPLLCKILDVRQNLSVQVHPSAGIAEKLGGDPKSEFWYAASVEEGAKWYAGLKFGTSREIFERRVKRGVTPECLHQLSVAEGEAMYVPSGRVHALGAGQIVFEIQQNSDTTYRIFDWARSGIGGLKRDLHIDEAMLSIDFSDNACDIIKKSEGCLVDCPIFRIEKINFLSKMEVKLHPREFSVIAVVSGGVICGGFSFNAGDHFLLPANVKEEWVIKELKSGTGVNACFLRVTWPRRLNT